VVSALAFPVGSIDSFGGCACQVTIICFGLLVRIEGWGDTLAVDRDLGIHFLRDDPKDTQTIPATLVVHERKAAEPCVTFELSRDDKGTQRLERKEGDV